MGRPSRAAIAPVTVAALVSAGLLSVVLFPPIALAGLRRIDGMGVTELVLAPVDARREER